MTKRNFGLDVLRAFAIIAVFLSHEVNINIGRINILSAFNSGVDLFFVLSGFLIGRICLQSFLNNTFSFWNFWRSRWWRTLPPYLAAILVYILMRSLYPPFPPLPAYYGAFLQNYLGVTGFAPSWSLCIEEHFYLCLPFLVCLAVRFLGIRSLSYILPTLFFMPLVLRLLQYGFRGGMPPQWYWLTHLHCEGMILGVWLAYIAITDAPLLRRLKSSSRLLLLLCPLLMAILPFWDTRPLMADLCLFTLYAVGYGAWLLWLYDLRWEPASRVGRAIRFGIVCTALCSYSIYLTHTTFDPFVRHILLANWHRGLTKSFLVMAITWLGGLVFYFLVERPAIISRDHYLKSKIVEVSVSPEANAVRL
jgi:peptidoglycan/LPS O-acetylase OafA/YrhL